MADIPKKTPLDSELEAARRSIHTDGYPMSIGELTNLYRDGELVISPPFQRLFRWDDSQKSRLIESILIGIPLPSIFVVQDEAGKWELVDGLQRVSTLLQLQGMLDPKEFPSLVLTETKYLPSLEGAVWESDTQPSLTSVQRLDIKRAKIDLKIVQRGSDPKTKFDLFQRLNSFGSKLSNQEIRNAQLVGVNPSFVAWLNEIANRESFVSLLRLPEADKAKKYDEELALRFLFLHSKSNDEILSIRSFQDELEEFSVGLASSFSDDVKHRLDEVFGKTFDRLQAADEDVLRRWDAAKNRFTGGFLNTSFEALAVGLGYLITEGSWSRQDLRAAAIEFWNEPEMTGQFATGKSTEARLRLMVPKGRKILSS
ncbi:DUF262 domain-containing protein [Mycetocola manganoxydans]|uniref:DUF262 domain-containing protein n=1 Tax=Mycetocola manganoxydans TaxID=699879 RepID=A0A3L6ZV29_9MICO|nr:DUF262 domain-containing protein [Mycetocola manganoxydans]RLP71747.1 DUF262 domain-containing protein [Mycetocola manganoxydans]GHD39371.1 hypothetical protein GCM10008097_01990 [Mycetocola manganoxydans]